MVPFTLATKALCLEQTFFIEVVELLRPGYDTGQSVLAELVANTRCGALVGIITALLRCTSSQSNLLITILPSK